MRKFSLYRHRKFFKKNGYVKKASCRMVLWVCVHLFVRASHLSGIAPWKLLTLSPGEGAGCLWGEGLSPLSSAVTLVSNHVTVLPTKKNTT